MILLFFSFIGTFFVLMSVALRLETFFTKYVIRSCTFMLFNKQKFDVFYLF